MVNGKKIEEGIRLLLEGIGEDAGREGLLETPERIARMYEELFAGMDQDAAEPLSRQFEVSEAGIVLEKDITFYSMCEHHMLPFFGKAHVAYLPDGPCGGAEQACQDGGGVREKAAAAGAADPRRWRTR